MSNSPSRREQLVGQIFNLYADLGWAVPTGIENARLVTLEDSVGVALNALESVQAERRRQAERQAAKRPNRPIDRHENAIVLYVDLCDEDGVDSGIAAYRVAKAFGLTEERLVQLARTWCALAGVPAPATTNNAEEATS